MGRVKFERVRLTGFGPYRETTEFIFAEGLNVFVAPNETGKSTLVAGVTALLFGLPQTTDPTVFGQARYRNWDHPLGFEGELLWQVDGESYRLRRNFKTTRSPWPSSAMVSTGRSLVGPIIPAPSGAINATRRN